MRIAQELAAFTASLEWTSYTANGQEDAISKGSALCPSRRRLRCTTPPPSFSLLQLRLPYRLEGQCGGASCFMIKNNPSFRRRKDPQILWEKEIDMMALQKFNLPLAFTGQEAIWQKVFQKFNISKSDLDDFFGGPAFLAWSRMGNLHGWGGPLPQSWLDQQLILQKRILDRMYELGMTPVLPAFSGNVPAALKTIYPSAKITQLGNWFSC